MSIDAYVTGLAWLPNGTVRLTLEQPDSSRCAGRSEIIVENPCPSMDALWNQHIWGGSEQILIGETTIARRNSYGSLTMLPEADEFLNKIPRAAR